MSDLIMYVIVNSKLSKSERIPQCGHAVAEFMSEYGQDPDVQEWVHNHRTMVCLHASEDDIDGIMDRVYWDLGNSGYRCWVDDDLTHRIHWASVAFRPMTRSDAQKYFGHLKLA